MQTTIATATLTLNEDPPNFFRPKNLQNSYNPEFSQFDTIIFLFITHYRPNYEVRYNRIQLIRLSITVVIYVVTSKGPTHFQNLYFVI